MDTDQIATLLAGVAIVIGVLGTIIPVLPGTALIAGAVLIWAIVVQSAPAWIALVVVLILLGGGELLKYVTAGRRISAAGVPNSALIVAGLAGLVGFFVIPVLGLPIGFILALTLLEYSRHQNWPDTWTSTKAALAAVGVMMLIELSTALLSATAWGIAIWQGALD